MGVLNSQCRHWTSDFDGVTRTYTCYFCCYSTVEVTRKGTNYKTCRTTGYGGHNMPTETSISQTKGHRTRRDEVKYEGKVREERIEGDNTEMNKFSYILRYLSQKTSQQKPTGYSSCLLNQFQKSLPSSPDDDSFLNRS